MEQQLAQIIEALHLRNWYAVAALVLTLLVQGVKKTPALQPLWLKIPDGYRWLLPVVSGAITGFTQAFASGWSLGVALLAAIGGAIGISIPAMGINAVLTESPAKWNGGAGGKPPQPKKPNVPPLVGLGMLALLALAAAPAVACTPPQSQTVAGVPHNIAVAYSALNAALEVVDTLEAAHLDSLETPTQDQLDRATVIVKRLQLARATLVTLHDDATEARDNMRAALADLVAAVQLAQVAGVRLPLGVNKALDTATELLQ